MTFAAFTESPPLPVELGRFIDFYVHRGVVWWIHKCAARTVKAPLDDRWGIKLEDSGEYSVVPATPGALHSILCTMCGCHGWITAGQWAQA